MIIREGSRYLIEGPITLDSVAILLGESAILEGDSVTVDLARVTNVDSSALSLLMEWTRRFGSSGRHIVFSDVGPNLRSLAQLYGVAELIPVAAD
jgi:phospholipid transport system transporter-binding protein